MCSIFATPEEAKVWAARHGQHRPKRPLAEKTLRRIARGTMKYVVDAAEPFIVELAHGDGPHGRWGDGSASLHDPLSTVQAGGGKHALVSPYLIPRHGEREGQAPRCMGVNEPMATVTGTANGAQLVAAFLSHFYTSNTRGGEGDPRKPAKTVTSGGQHAAVAACMVKHYGGVVGQPIDRPLGTVTGVDHHSVVAAFLQTYYGQSEDGIDIDAPCPTVTGTDRVGLVIVKLAGEPYVLVDIAMRMLTPRELARAQGFDDDYVIDAVGRDTPRAQRRMGSMNGRLSKRDQVKLIGNSVCPPVIEALVRSNVVAQGVMEDAGNPRELALVAERSVA